MFECTHLDDVHERLELGHSALLGVVVERARVDAVQILFRQITSIYRVSPSKNYSNTQFIPTTNKSFRSADIGFY